MNHNKNEMRLAVLIDADNIPRTSIKGIMSEIAIFGKPTIKRMYGDFTSSYLSGLKKIMLDNAITPIQQYGYTVGKNSTDSVMIIDAMDILYTHPEIDGFCIVSSDSDFTRLATRLKEAGKFVVGFGEKKTPNPFIVSCDKFVYVEIIKKEQEENDIQKIESILAADNDVIKLISSSIADIADEDGYAFLGEVGNLILKKQPDFDSRNYGYMKLSQLLKSLDKYFETDIRQTERRNIKHIYVRLKT